MNISSMIVSLLSNNKKNEMISTEKIKAESEGTGYVGTFICL